MERMTVTNHNGHFRIPAERMGVFRMDPSGHSIAIFGDVADRLGQYEDLLTMEEAQAYARKRTKK